jgi:hypothetical protein
MPQDYKPPTTAANLRAELTCCRWWREHGTARCPECAAWRDRMDQTARDERAFTGPRGEKP